MLCGTSFLRNSSIVCSRKILAIVLEFLLEKDKRVQELFDTRETTCKLHSYEHYKGICHDLVNSSTFRWKMPRYEHGYVTQMNHYSSIEHGGTGTFSNMWYFRGKFSWYFWEVNFCVTILWYFCVGLLVAGGFNGSPCI